MTPITKETLRKAGWHRMFVKGKFSFDGTCGHLVLSWQYDKDKMGIYVLRNDLENVTVISMEQIESAIGIWNINKLNKV